MSRRTAVVLGLAAALCLAGLAWLSQREARAVRALVEENVSVRGGADAWHGVQTVRMTGRMDVGQQMQVPYVLEQKRPDKMRLEFQFDGQTVVQCTDGRSGWKIAPFRGSSTPEPMTADELREVVDLADPYGILFDYARRGHDVDLLGHETVDGHDALVLEVTLPGGAVRRVFLDAQTGLELRIEATRSLAGRERKVVTTYGEWRTSDGLLFPRRQETRTEGERESHALTVETVQVNTPIDDARFAMPTVAGG